MLCNGGSVVRASARFTTRVSSLSLIVNTCCKMCIFRCKANIYRVVRACIAAVAGGLLGCVGLGWDLLALGGVPCVNVMSESIFAPISRQLVKCVCCVFVCLRSFICFYSIAYAERMTDSEMVLSFSNAPFQFAFISPFRELHVREYHRHRCHSRINICTTERLYKFYVYEYKHAAQALMTAPPGSVEHMAHMNKHCLFPAISCCGCTATNPTD